MDTSLEIRLFGGLHLTVSGAPLTGFMSAKVPALLAYLAMTGRVQRRDNLAGLLWGELPDADARNNLRQALANLRRSLEPWLVITRDDVALRVSAAGDLTPQPPSLPGDLTPQPPSLPGKGGRGGGANAYFLDVAAFEAQLYPDPALPLEAQAAQLEAATALYSGDFLAGFFVRDAPTFEEWMLAQRARYRELALHALHRLTQLQLNQGRYDLAIRDATRLLALDEWREEAHGQLMLALARTGQRSAALAQYARCRRVLRAEFGVEPSAETAALHERIRLAMAGSRHNLLAAATDFVGRERETAELRRLLAGPNNRLLTLLGPGGAGKTRLACEAARACEAMFLNGIWLADLTTLTDPAALPWALAEAVNCPLIGSAPLTAQLLDYLRGRELLLVLDGFEHLKAPASLNLIHRILQEAPDVKLLVTSRERLGLTAERLLPLAGLDYPAGSTDDIAAYPAVQLFVRRSQRLRPTLAIGPADAPAVAQLCQMTAGLPLALELAAALTWLLSPVEIVAELQAGLASMSSNAADLPERHRSLAAVFEHSWRLLDQDGRAALAQLSCFRDGFDGRSAQAVADADRRILQALGDRSLVQADLAGRFDMHPLVQQFAAEKLALDPWAAEAARTRHARYFARLAARHEEEFHGADDRQALARMAQDAANILAAWDRAVELADPALLEPFLESFLYFFDIGGRYRECVELTGRAIAALQAVTAGPAPVEHKRALGRILALHAAFQFRLGAFDIARQRAQEALQRLEPLRPQRDVGHARLYLGAACYGLGDLNQAGHWFLAAAQAYEESGHGWGVGAALDNAGYLEFLRGNPEAAKGHLTAGLAIAQKTGSRYLLTGIYDHLAMLYAAQADFPTAMRCVTQCQQVLEEMDRPYIVASLSLSLSQIALQAGDLTGAEAHVQRALQMARNSGNRLDLTRFLLQAGAVARGRGDRAAAEAAYGEAARLAQAMRARALLAEAQAGLATCARR